MSKNCGFRYCKGMDDCFLAGISPCLDARPAPRDALVSDNLQRSRVVSRIGFVGPSIYDDDARR